MPEPPVIPPNPIRKLIDYNRTAKVIPPTRKEERIREQIEQYNHKVRRAKELKKQQQQTPKNPKVVTQLYCNLCQTALSKSKPKKVEGFAIDITIPVWKCEICCERFSGYGSSVKNSKGQLAIVSSMELL